VLQWTAFVSSICLGCVCFFLSVSLVMWFPGGDGCQSRRGGGGSCCRLRLWRRLQLWLRLWLRLRFLRRLWRRHWRHRLRRRLLLLCC
jgi:hypothetical protein